MNWNALNNPKWLILKSWQFAGQVMSPALSPGLISGRVCIHLQSLSLTRVGALTFWKTTSSDLLCLTPKLLFKIAGTPRSINIDLCLSLSMILFLNSSPSAGLSQMGLETPMQHPTCQMLTSAPQCILCETCLGLACAHRNTALTMWHLCHACVACDSSSQQQMHDSPSLHAQNHTSHQHIFCCRWFDEVCKLMVSSSIFKQHETPQMCVGVCQCLLDSGRVIFLHFEEFCVPWNTTKKRRQQRPVTVPNHMSNFVSLIECDGLKTHLQGFPGTHKPGAPIVLLQNSNLELSFYQNMKKMGTKH